MNAVPRSARTQRNRSQQSLAISKDQRSRIARPPTDTIMSPKTPKPKVENVSVLQQQTPIFLKALLFLKLGSDIVTFTLIATAVTVYSWTVYSQQQWTQEYRKLEELQRDERNMTATTEVIKDQLAQQAENPATGLVTPNPSNTIFLKRAPERPQRQPFTAFTKPPEPKPKKITPLGY
ncbi:hypothetical protein [Moorena producens]|uniref:hypothetical protein n=1 Tax=Moorena producens TaxID=1155739 RepID=UPI003C7470F9